MSEEEVILYNGKTKEEILKNMVYSYSSVNGFSTCKTMFKLTYLDKVKRVGNIFSEFGTAAHNVMEKLFSNECEVWDLNELFLDLYKETVVTPPPASLGQKYEEGMLDGLSKFFSTTNLNVDNYEVLCMEEKLEYAVDDINIVVKPDLILRRKSDGKVLLWDYKTSGYKKSSHEGYAYQCSLYAKIYELVKGIHVDELTILYFKETVKPRGKDLIYGKFVNMVYDESVLDIFISDVKKIRQEKAWDATPDQFFCCNICSVKTACEAKEHFFGV